MASGKPSGVGGKGGSSGGSCLPNPDKTLAQLNLMDVKADQSTKGGDEYRVTRIEQQGSWYRDIDAVKDYPTIDTCVKYFWETYRPSGCTGVQIDCLRAAYIQVLRYLHAWGAQRVPTMDEAEITACFSYRSKDQGTVALWALPASGKGTNDTGLQPGKRCVPDLVCRLFREHRHTIVHDLECKSCRDLGHEL